MITKEAQNKTAYTLHKYFFNSARSAFKQLLQTILMPNDIILIPAYIGQSAREGSGVFDPIRQTNTKYLFYKINSDLSVNTKDLFKKLKNPKVKAVLLIHYFGFPQKNIFKIKEECQKRKVYLIEDCAHTFCSRVNGILCGTIGDFALHSIHKLIAADDGGILTVNRPNIEIQIKNSNKISLETLTCYANTDIEKTAQGRCRNYNMYLDLLSKNARNYTIMFPELPEGVVPLNFPILIKNYKREKYYYDLIDKGIITVSLYYRMIDELDSVLYPEAFELSEHILNLPVHQDILPEDIEEIVMKMGELEK